MDYEDGEPPKKRPREDEEEEVIVDPEILNTIKLRNYFPRDRMLKKCVTKTLPDYFTETKEKFIELLEKAKDEDALVELAPKKDTWDLQRELQPRLDKLDLMTQKMIVEMLKVKVGKK
mmetsp:Transcript_11001/g.12085  ORF Transcript_11001/g.12085 Transcript_11001/m.12085 type:complete len:118 (-) Transcript_11001:105-458(-)|eukprot:CAMPEP_0168526248 /NCGR_PEP_ID=MMETSP0405-20121227/11848_1 /TAXON_ID=498012 /ORGANISM="Trichosphaerium sp, Strain Am-I-7 wt" /LENGTH=117 /DNA_ID=CAMNT_0008549041 /DNA_START=14 /DNA_END=367 /DNA_ORIENTATION=+